MRRARLMLLLSVVAGCAGSGDAPAPTADTGGATSDAGAPDTGAPDTGAHDTSAEAAEDALDDVAVDLLDAPDGSSGDVAEEVGVDGSGCPFDGSGTERLDAPPIYTPRWAFAPWISKDISTGPDARAFVDGFRTRDIPVGVIVLDSPWETHYNTFVPNPARYPEFATMVSDFRTLGVRTVLWTTQMINRVSFDAELGGDLYAGPSPNHAEAAACGFFVQEGAEYSWWKGFGSAIDFFDPRARAWWHAQQDAVLDTGIAGWKLDFGDEYVTDDPIQTEVGAVTHQAYSEEYYRDFLAYGVGRRGAEEFVTMVRPYDMSYQFSGRFFARPEHAPVAWVGDNRRDWVGFVDALDHTFRSALAGYVVIGSDIGGYLDRNDTNLSERIPFDEHVLTAWVAQAALTPFMQLHGRANLEPWAVGADPERTVANYRYWATLHTELVPFWYSLAQESYAGRAAGIVRPVLEDPSAWVGDWRYALGDAFLVAPITAPPDESGAFVRSVSLPDDSGWYDWYDLTAPALAPGAEVPFEAPSTSGRIPLYVREGAIVPMDIGSDATGIGDATWAGADVVFVVPPSPSARSVFRRHDDRTSSVDIEVSSAPGAGVVRVAVSRTPRALRVVVRLGADPAGATLDGASIPRAEGDPPAPGPWYTYDERRAIAVVFVPASGGSSVVELLPDAGG